MLAAVLASVPDAIVTADLDVRIRLVNPAAEQLLGLRADEIRGRDAIETLIDPADREPARGWVDRLTAGEPAPSGVLGPADARRRVLLLGRGLGLPHPRRRRRRDRHRGHAARCDRAAGGGGGRRDAAGDRRRRRPRRSSASTARATSCSSARPPSACTAGSADEVIGKPVTVLIAEHQLTCCRRWSRRWPAGETVHREGVALRRDGSHLEAELNASPIMGADGRDAAARR